VTRTIETFTLEIGALHRKGVMVRLDQWGLRYVEHRGFLDSTIIIQVFSDADLKKLYKFKHEFRTWQLHLQAIDDEIENEKLDREYHLAQKKLARKNRWRRLTFRKPLKALI
jgi:hypothetical protein